MSLSIITYSSQVFIGTPTGIVVVKKTYTCFDSDDMDFEPMLESAREASPSPDVLNPLVALVLAAKKAKNEWRKKNAHWFHDENGKLRFGKISAINSDEPMFAMDEEYYHPLTRTLYWLETPPHKPTPKTPPQASFTQRHHDASALKRPSTAIPTPCSRGYSAALQQFALTPNISMCRPASSSREKESPILPSENDSFATQITNRSFDRFYPTSSSSSRDQ